MRCDEASRLIARRADGVVDSAADRTALDAHLSACEACRNDLEAQRAVAAILRSRPVQQPSAAFARRLAARLDEASGWLGLTDFRAWTFRLVPLAAALAFVVVYTAGSSPDRSSTSSADLMRGVVVDSTSAASVLWQQDLSSESLLELVVTGRTASGAGEFGNVR